MLTRCEESSDMLTPSECLLFKPHLALLPAGEQLVTFTVFAMVINCFHAVVVSKEGNGLSKKAVHRCLALCVAGVAVTTVAFVTVIARRHEDQVHACCYTNQVTPWWFFRFYYSLYVVFGSLDVLLLLCASVQLKCKPGPADEQIRRIYNRRTRKVFQQTLLMGAYSLVFQTIPAICGLLLSTFPQLASLIKTLWACVPVGCMLEVKDGACPIVAHCNYSNKVRLNCTLLELPGNGIFALLDYTLVWESNKWTFKAELLSKEIYPASNCHYALDFSNLPSY
uniref:G-protein coupled receptors family 1 profile domain-containing protein n=1 Tax=Trichuris muris TaxID=70415 RepID=A0A5S6QT46_TRIMR